MKRAIRFFLGLKKVQLLRRKTIEAKKKQDIGHLQLEMISHDDWEHVLKTSEEEGEDQLHSLGSFP